MRILVVEDDRRVAASLKQGLEEAGFESDVSHTAGLAKECVRSTRYDLVILDLGLPDGDGLEVLEVMRMDFKATPVLILTARDSVDDRVRGLDQGADDYLVKPFSFSELLARIRALLRRAGGGERLTLTVADLTIDVVGRTVARGGQELDLSPREFDLLEYLARSADHIVSREALARDVWKVTSRATPIDNVIDVHISHLREKIDKPFEQKLLHTVRGVGFTLKVSS